MVTVRTVRRNSISAPQRCHAESRPELGPNRTGGGVLFAVERRLISAAKVHLDLEDRRDQVSPAFPVNIGILLSSRRWFVSGHNCKMKRVPHQKAVSLLCAYNRGEAGRTPNSISRGGAPGRPDALLQPRSSFSWRRRVRLLFTPAGARAQFIGVSCANWLKAHARCVAN